MFLLEEAKHLQVVLCDSLVIWWEWEWEWDCIVLYLSRITTRVEFFQCHTQEL